MDFKQLEDLKRKCVKNYAAVHGLDSLRTLLPVAFPMYRSTWKLRLRVAKTTGLVDRQLLMAVQKFGPISSADVAELLGLDEVIVESSLKDLARGGVRLSQEGILWQLAPETEIEHFYVEQTHAFGFVSNGLTGDFLPLNRVKTCDGARLTTAEAKKLIVIKPERSSAEGELLKKLKTSKRAHLFAAYGIPDNFLSFEKDQPEDEKVDYVVAFLFVDRDGAVEIMPATEAGFAFDAPVKLCKRYLKSLEQKKQPQPEYKGIKFKDTDNLRIVEVTEKSLWQRESFNDDECVDEVRLLKAMIYPGWKCDFDGTFRQLVPGDEKTMRDLAFKRGLSLLKRTYSRVVSDERYVVELAEQFRDACEREFPKMKSPPTFTEVLQHALNSSDSEVVALAASFVKRKAVMKQTTHPEFKFIHSRGPLFQKTLVDAIDSAQDSIRIITPVFTEESIFSALEHAKNRGVRDIRVITQLKEPRNNIFKTDPQFSDYKLPRRQLAALGVVVRDCEHTVHAKLVIVDSRWSFFTTANLNANSLGVGGVKAIEAGLICNDTIATDALGGLFEELWSGANYFQTRNEDHITISAMARRHEIRMSRCINYARGYTFLLSTPENQLLTRRMSTLLAAAKKEVTILSMSFYDLELVPGLFVEFQKALERGVKIKVCVRPGEEMNFPSEQWPDPSTKKLQDAGLDLYTCDHLHAKGMVVDGKTVLMTSANFNQFSLGCSQTAHLEMAILGTTEQKPLAAFAEFVKATFKTKDLTETV